MLRHIRLLIIVPMTVTIGAYFASALITPIFTGRTVIIPPQQPQSALSAALQNLGSLGGLAGGAAGIRSTGDYYVALLQSDTVSRSLVEQFNLKIAYKANLRTEAQLILERRSRIYAGRKDGLITVEVDDEDAKVAAAIANAYVSELRKLIAALSVNEAQQRRAFFEEQLKQTQVRFAQAQRTLQASGFSEGTLKAEPRTAAESFAKLAADVASAEVRVELLRRRYTESAPELQTALAQLAALRGQISRRETEDVRARDNDYLARYRNFKYQEALLDLFSRQYELARVDESRDAGFIQVVDVASPAEIKSSPKRGRISLFCGLVALIIAILFVAIRNSRLNPSTAPRVYREPLR